jgi:hypothetical protein
MSSRFKENHGVFFETVNTDGQKMLLLMAQLLNSLHQFAREPLRGEQHRTEGKFGFHRTK